MNQSVYDITEAVGRDIQPVRDLLGYDATTNYLRNMVLTVLKLISNPSLNPANELVSVLLMQGVTEDRTGISQMTARVCQSLYNFLNALPFEKNSRMLTVIDVTITPVSYQLTLGHVA